MMEKKPKTTVKTQSAKTATVSNQRPSFLLSSGTIITLLISVLYLLIHFITDFGAYDAMGPQWLYMVALDFVVVLYILARKDDYIDAVKAIFGNLFSKLYLAYFALAGFSIFFAINPTEGWVGYARLIATVIAFFNLAILFYGRTDLFKWIAQIFGFILLIESSQAISQFLKESSELDFTILILNLKGTTGNKNIFAASNIIKIPFVLYCIHTSKIGGKILNILILLIAALCIFIVNARASFVSLILISILYIIYCLLDFQKNKRGEVLIYRISTLIVPIIAAALISQILIFNIKTLQDQKGVYGTVSERLGTVANFNSEDNQVRINLWKHTIDYTKKHPIVGCGVSNWKIASIPYQRTITDDLIVPVHSHNDFLETFAELGIPGGLLYLSIFVCIVFFSISVFRSETADQETKYISLFSFLAFTGYSVDAFFNFPLERPISQILFAFVVSLNIISFIQSKKSVTIDNEKSDTSNSTVLKPIWGIVSILSLLPAFYVTFLTNQSLVLQKSVMADLNNEPLKMDWKEVIAKFPSIPNLTATAQPVDAIKGRYLYEAGHYDEALVLLDKGREANPAIGYSEFLKAGLYFKIGKMDSARRNGLTAFYTRPKAKTYFQTLIAILAKQKDTVEIKRAFTEINTYRKFGFAWNLYILGILNATGKGTPELLALTDSALHMFAKDTVAVRDLTKRRMEVIQNMATTPGAKNPAFDLAASQNYYRQAVAAFGTGNAAKDNLGKAAELFIKASSLNPVDYTNYENAAICYYNIQNFSKALIYFDKALERGSSNGKSDFFKGVVLINLGRKDEGCKSLLISRNRGYKEKEAELNTILKNNCNL